jgi:hypothetical protein
MMQARTSVNPHIHFGKPCVAGTRIPALNVLELVSEGLPFAMIVRDYYPEIQIVMFQPRPEAGTQRALEGVGCKPWFGQPLAGNSHLCWRTLA